MFHPTSWKENQGEISKLLVPSKCGGQKKSRRYLNIGERSVWKHSSTCFCMEFHWTNADWKIDISFNLSDMPTSKISLDTESFIPYSWCSCYSHAVMQHLLHDSMISLRTASEKCMQLQHQRRIQWPHWKNDLNWFNRIKLKRAMKPPDTTFIRCYLYSLPRSCLVDYCIKYVIICCCCPHPRVDRNVFCSLLGYTFVLIFSNVRLTTWDKLWRFFLWRRRDPESQTGIPN